MDNFSEYAPRTVAGGTAPRDQGTNIRLQTAQQLASGTQSIVAGIENIARDRVQEQAKSDMGAFQAELINKEGEFKRSAATAKNPDELKKLTDKYIKDLNNYAGGKRPDGTEVFRNGMGKTAYKQFSVGYQAKVREQATQQAFEMDRKRDRLNYRMAINSGIKNNNPEAIRQSYSALVEDGHMTQEEATIQSDQAMSEMSITYFKETQAKMMLGVEEALNQTYKPVSFDGSGMYKQDVKPDLNALKNTVTDAVTTYKTELYADKNLNDQQRLALLNSAKQSMKYLESAKKAEYTAQKEAIEIEKGNIHAQYLRDIATNPGQITEIGKQYLAQYPNMDEKTLNKITTQSLDAHTRFQKAQNDFASQYFDRWGDLATKREITSASISNPKDYQTAIDKASTIGDSTLKSETLKWINDNAPGKEPKDPMLKQSLSTLNTDLTNAFGLDLTRSQVEKLSKHERWGVEDTIGWQFKPDDIPDESLELIVGGLSKGKREQAAYQIQQRYSKIYAEQGQQAADDYAEKTLLEINSTNNKRTFYNKYIDFIKPKVR